MGAGTKRMRSPHRKRLAREGDASDAEVSAKSGRPALNPLSITNIWYNPLIFSHRLTTVAAYFKVIPIRTMPAGCF